tara:strand:+ start:364 stop:699 length:336 start_codon:yes stop_codon:yes gene_type:complete
MEVSGKLVKVLDLEQGTSKAGKDWQKQSIVLDNGGEFNNEVCVSAFGDKVNQIADLKIGVDMKILCNVYSREYKGRYYNSIDGYHFAQVNQTPPEGLDKHFAGTTPDDLPF